VSLYSQEAEESPPEPSEDLDDVVDAEVVNG